MWINKKDELLQVVKKNEKVLLYGTGWVGKTVARFLKKCGKEKEILALIQTNVPKKKTILEVFPVDTIGKFVEIAKEALVIMAVRPETVELGTKTLTEYGFSNICVVAYELYCEILREEHIKTDFVCAGFVKSGTTSLYTALRKHPDIFLPQEKETHYMGWRKRYEDAPDRYNKRHYANVKKGKVVGAIEPSYRKSAVGIYESFGPDVKLIFMMRNPADAAYSNFKMMMRRPKCMQLVKYYFKYRKFSVKMFDDYIDDYVTNQKDPRFCYDVWIEQYCKLFKPENMFFIFFEEIISEPEKVFNELQEFLGVKIKKYGELPHSNDGKEVSKNLICAWINYKLIRKKIYLKSEKNKEEQERHKEFCRNIRKYTLVDNYEKMKPEQRKRLDKFFEPSIKKLEEITGKSLKGIWYS